MKPRSRAETSSRGGWAREGISREQPRKYVNNNKINKQTTKKLHSCAKTWGMEGWTAEGVLQRTGRRYQSRRRKCTGSMVWKHLKVTVERKQYKANQTSRGNGMRARHQRPKRRRRRILYSFRSPLNWTTSRTGQFQGLKGRGEHWLMSTTDRFPHFWILWYDKTFEQVAIFRHGQSVLATSAKCPHAGGPLHLGDIEVEAVNMEEGFLKTAPGFTRSVGLPFLPLAQVDFHPRQGGFHLQPASTISQNSLQSRRRFSANWQNGSQKGGKDKFKFRDLCSAARSVKSQTRDFPREEIWKGQVGNWFRVHGYKYSDGWTILK